jgi:hypothetical protein
MEVLHGWIFHILHTLCDQSYSICRDDESGQVLVSWFINPRSKKKSWDPEQILCRRQSVSLINVRFVHVYLFGIHSFRCPGKRSNTRFTRSIHNKSIGGIETSKSSKGHGFLYLSIDWSCDASRRGEKNRKRKVIRKGKAKVHACKVETRYIVEGSLKPGYREEQKKTQGTKSHHTQEEEKLKVYKKTHTWK